MSPTGPVLQASGVSRHFGYRPVVRSVSFSLAAGDVLLLTGPNGAGKTTLLRLCAGLLTPTAGTVTRLVAAGLVAHDAMVYDALSARENLRFFARLHGVRDATRVDDLLARLDLTQRADDRVGTYSRGMLQRVAIARALLPAPGMLLLDEPLSGLDVRTVAVLRNLLADERARGTAMILVSHQVDALADLTTRRADLADGTLTEAAHA